jgi:uncharacterized protein (TIGR02246 family)
MKRTLTALALSLAFVAPAFADDAMSISKQINDKWLEAYNKGDAATLVALYTSDAILMPQGSAQPVIGEVNIRKFFDGWLQQKLDNGSIPITEAKMLDPNTLFTAGTWSAEVPATNSAPKMQVGGTYLAIAVRDGTEWRVRADTWNMMPPPSAQPAAAAASTTSSGSTTPNK